MNFCGNSKQESISQEVHRNTCHILNLSQGIADAKHFNPLGWRSNFLLNPSINQDNPLHANTITQEIKQHYPADMTIKDKINSWSTTMLVDSESVATIINTELFEQINNKF